MNDWKEDIRAALQSFETVASLARQPVRQEDWHVEFLDAPHCPPSSLPKGMMAIYGFWGDGGWLKIGLIGDKSGPRYTSQHYLPNGAKSTLAKSLASDARMVLLTGFDPSAPGYWIKNACHRVNILLPAPHGRPLMAMLEAFLHVLLKPRYERTATSAKTALPGKNPTQSAST